MKLFLIVLLMHLSALCYSETLPEPATSLVSCVYVDKDHTSGTVYNTELAPHEDVVAVYEWLRLYCEFYECVVKHCDAVEEFPSTEDSERKLKQYVK